MSDEKKMEISNGEEAAKATRSGEACLNEQRSAKKFFIENNSRKSKLTF